MDNFGDFDNIDIKSQDDLFVSAVQVCNLSYF